MVLKSPVEFTMSEFCSVIVIWNSLCGPPLYQADELLILASYVYRMYRGLLWNYFEDIFYLRRSPSQIGQSKSAFRVLLVLEATQESNPCPLKPRAATLTTMPRRSLVIDSRDKVLNQFTHYSDRDEVDSSLYHFIVSALRAPLWYQSAEYPR